MLSRTPVSKRRLGRWALETMAGLLAAAVLAWAVIPSPAAPAPEPQAPKENPKKEEPARRVVPDFPVPDFLPDLEKLFPPGTIDPEQLKEIKKAMEDARKQVEELRKQFGGFQPGGRFRALPFGRLDEETRMGARLQKPSGALVDQLNLPEKQGLVLNEVKADSAAARAGLKNHDILLELGGKPVPSDLDEFQKQLKDIKPDSEVDAVVLRKGKRETVKGLKLPEAKEQPNPFRNLQRFQPGNFPFPGGVVPGVRVQVQVGDATVTRNADGSFTASSEQGGVKLTVTGKTEDGKAKVEQIEVNDGKEVKKYKSVTDVPEAQREAVKKLIETSEGGGGFFFQFKFNTPP